MILRLLCLSGIGKIKMKKMIGIALGLGLAFAASADVAVGIVINFNIGENANGYETMGGEVWNNTAIGTNSDIQDNGGGTVSAADVSNAVYTLEYATNLAVNTWISMVVDRAATLPQNIYSTNAPAAEVRYYRVRGRRTDR